MPSFSVTLDTKALADALDGIGEDIARASRPAAQAGAQVLYDRVLQNVAALGTKTGNLRSAIYQAFQDKESKGGAAYYRIGWNFTKAPHGQLVEFGHIQHFKAYVGSDGKWYTRVRPEALGYKVIRDESGKMRTVKDPNGRRLPKPGRKASLAQKMAYYDPLPGGPKQVAARPFVRNAAASFPAALQAAEDRFFAEMKK